MGLVTRSSTSLAERSGHLHKDIDHGHDDLRLFFPGKHQHRADPQQDRSRNDEGRQL